MTNRMKLRTIAEDLFEILNDRVISDEELPQEIDELIVLIQRLTDALHLQWRQGE